ncbi:methyltransferase [Legionella quateirensis]|uniref:Methyltransferase n=1 Tax=Legionella quateirensis TaxID=45072 RepID=A0A378KXT2_9GAMM|nr:methyltransferase [Legionella quateirensis]KTD43421.1 methyltransferase [Legionella quateirensis]STY18307.1 methyltransferase [Legionella quateirensis]
MIKSWIKAWFTKGEGQDYKEQPVSPSPAPVTPRPNADFYNNYFTLIASGARLKLVEAMFNLDIFSLFEHQECVSEQEIIDQLQLMPIRAKKWLHLLSSEHFLIKTTTKDYQTAYKLPKEFVFFMNSDLWWGIRFFFGTWRVGAEENLTDVLRFGKVKVPVSWPPKTDEETYWLEHWMAKTADQPVENILAQIDFSTVSRVLDVGGGDGTMACEFARAHPHIKVTVYNLPKAAELARQNIDSQGLSDRVSVYEGDFIKDDAFPLGFDLILFTRVLFDWNEQVDRKLLRMAYQCLPQNGLVGICEFYKEENHDRCLASEYRYLFHDDFAPHVMKTAACYRAILEEIGFTVVIPNTQPKIGFSYTSLILAQK